VARLSQGHYALETSVRNYIKFLKDSDKETATKQKSDLAAEKLRRAKSDAGMSQLNCQIKSGIIFPFAMSRKSKKLAKRDDDETEDKPVDDHESSQDGESRVRLFAWVRLFRRSLKVFDCVILPPKNVPQG